jgi:hypothetical protein
MVLSGDSVEKNSFRAVLRITLVALGPIVDRGSNVAMGITVAAGSAVASGKSVDLG